MTGRGSIRHNNRSFSAANVDRSRSGQNVTFCNEDLKKVYHELFDEALAAYNAKKKKTRDKIPDYYEHIRQSKQEKLFHEAIFQIGNLTDCGCGSSGGERAAAQHILDRFLDSVDTDLVFGIDAFVDKQVTGLIFNLFYNLRNRDVFHLNGNSGILCRCSEYVPKQRDCEYEPKQSSKLVEEYCFIHIFAKF